MNESKYWKDMYIMREESEDKIISSSVTDNTLSERDSIIISTSEPIGLECDNIKTNIELINEKDIRVNQIIEFINKNNKMDTGNITLISSELLKKIFNMGSYVMIMTDMKNMTVLGTILSIPLSIKVINNCQRSDNENNYNIVTHGCTTFLCMDKRLRGLGLGMKLIRSMTKLGYKNNIYCGYHITSEKRSNNDIPIKCWYRPIKLDRARQAGFKFATYTKQGDRNNNRDKIAYTTKLPKDVSVIKADSNNLNEIYEYYIKETSNKKLSYYPDIKQWQCWIESFDTYVVKNFNDIVGVFTLSTMSSLITQTNNTIELSTIILSCGDPHHTLKGALYISRDKDLLYGYKNMHFNDQNIKDINAVTTKIQLWLSFYNNKIEINSYDICLPLL